MARFLLVHHGVDREERVEPMLAAKGHAVDWLRPPAGDRLPADTGRYAGVVVFGGAMHVEHAPELPWLQEEIGWIADHVAGGGALLGICLGSQLLAHAMGGRVGPHPEGMTQIGYFPVHATPAGAGLFPDPPLEVYHWHEQGFELPAGAELLATGADFPNQAFRSGRCYGLQFHPEVTPRILRRWLDDGAHHLTRPGARSLERQLADCERCNDRLEAWLDAFLDHWTAVALDPGEPAPAAARRPAVRSLNY
jgi:GMP synthase (glutamine-hydrolysing)